jgi:L-aminopeptidase/D-esterase-like protein
MNSSVTRLDAVEGIMEGHAVSEHGLTGVSLLIFPEGASASASIRGYASGTRQFDAMSLTHTVERVYGFVASGGSVFGHEAATAIVRMLSANKIGIITGETCVPVVPGAVIFDLSFPGNVKSDYRRLGMDAVEIALAGEESRNWAGAGAGATVGNVRGLRYATKTTRGSSLSVTNEGYHIGAFVVLNAFGDVRDASGTKVAGVRGGSGEGFVDTEDLFRKGFKKEPFSRMDNTTITVIVTDGEISRRELKIVAGNIHNVLGRYIVPYGTIFDGDSVFAFSTGVKARVENLMQFVTIAGDRVYDALMSAVFSAESGGGVICARDI